MTLVISEAELARAVDIDGDGDVDLVSASPQGIAWHQNEDGRGRFGPPQIITPEFAVVEGSGNGRGGPKTLIHLVDIDGDGDMDLLWDREQAIVWFENQDGRGNFGQQLAVMTSAGEPIATGRGILSTADLDGDGDVDLIYEYYAGQESARVVWYRNLDGKGLFGPSVSVGTDDEHPRGPIYTADMDGDGDVDVLSSCEAQSAWAENLDGNGAFDYWRNTHWLPQYGRLGGAGNAALCQAADIDGNGLLDVVATSSHAGYIFWFRNLTAGQIRQFAEGARFDAGDLVVTQIQRRQIP